MALRLFSPPTNADSFNLYRKILALFPHKNDIPMRNHDIQQLRRIEIVEVKGRAFQAHIKFEGLFSKSIEV